MYPRLGSLFRHNKRRQFRRFAFRAALQPPAGRKGLQPDIYLGLPAPQRAKNARRGPRPPQAGIYRPFSALKAEERSTVILRPTSQMRDGWQPLLF